MSTRPETTLHQYREVGSAKPARSRALAIQGRAAAFARSCDGRGRKIARLYLLGPLPCAFRHLGAGLHR